MDKEEFCNRFVARMLKQHKTFDDGSSVEECAKETAPTYYDDQYINDGETPEDCADSDISYWGE